MPKGPTIKNHPASHIAAIVQREPAYLQIEQDLRSRIERRQWPVNYRLPSRLNLAHEYGVDINTLQRAIASLLEDGTLRADGPRGTFVAKQIERSLSPTEAMPQMISPPIEATLLRKRTNAHVGVISVIYIGEESIEDFSGKEAQSWYDYRPYNRWGDSVVSSFERSFCGAGGSVTHLTHVAADDVGLSVDETVEKLLSTGIDACVIINLYAGFRAFDDLIVSFMNHSSLPLVAICHDELPYPVPHVFYDQHYSGYSAAEHLIQMGYTESIVFLTPFPADWVQSRIAGARAAIRNAELPPTLLRLFPPQIPPRPEAYDAAQISFECAEALFAEWIANGSKDRFAIIAPNDTSAFAVYKAAQAVGLQAGKDFGLIGFDDDYGSRAIGLTTLRPPLEELGQEAAGFVLEALSGTRSMRRQTRLQWHLISRRSVHTGK